MPVAILLPDGRVLAAAGDIVGEMGSACEVYDPATGQWTPAHDLVVRRRRHAGVLLPDGLVFFVGGQAGMNPAHSCELYDLSGGVSSLTGVLGEVCQQVRLVQLLDQSVLRIGGVESVGFTPLSTVECYRRQTERWAPVPRLSVGRVGPRATLLKDGRVLVTGGQGRKNGSWFWTAACDVHTPPGSAR